MSTTCPDDHPHGRTLSCYYTHDCRCADCRLARADHDLSKRATSTIRIRLAMENEADRLADAEAALLERWRDIATRRAAVELALKQLPDVVAPTHPAAAEELAA